MALFVFFFFFIVEGIVVKTQDGEVYFGGAIDVFFGIVALCYVSGRETGLGVVGVEAVFFGVTATV